MICLKLFVMFNFKICGSLPSVFMNIFLARGLPCANAFSVLLFSGHDELETGLLPFWWNFESFSNNFFFF